MRGSPEIDDSTAHSGESTKSHHSDGSTPKEGPPGGLLPAPIPTLCDHRVLTGRQLRSPTVVARLRNSTTVPANYSARLDRLSLEIAPAYKGLLPPATRDLGCAVQYELPAIAGFNTRGPFRTLALQFRLSNANQWVRDHDGQGPTLR